MSLILSGTDGLSDVDGSASTPAIRGTDANTGIFFPAADTIAFSEGGAESMRIDSSGNVGINTTTPNKNVLNKALTVNSTTGYAGFEIAVANTITADFITNASNAFLTTRTAIPLVFQTNDTERMRIASDGAISAGSTTGTVGLGVFSNYGSRIVDFARYADDGAIVGFKRGATLVGNISVTGSATAYNTSSDYRLKENIAPMVGALNIVSALKPVTYKWKVDGSTGQGFIAHELAEVVPQAVTGEKDALDKDGNPEYQGVDVSFLVATLTAAIQELKAELDTVKAELNTLKNPPAEGTE
jgi:hypothetical protein